MVCFIRIFKWLWLVVGNQFLQFNGLTEVGVLDEACVLTFCQGLGLVGLYKMFKRGCNEKRKILKRGYVRSEGGCLKKGWRFDPLTNCKDITSRWKTKFKERKDGTFFSYIDPFFFVLRYYSWSCNQIYWWKENKRISNYNRLWLCTKNTLAHSKSLKVFIWSDRTTAHSGNPRKWRIRD